METTDQTPEEIKQIHKTRWLLSMDWIDQSIGLKSDSRVLEVASRNQFTELCESRFGLHIDNTDGDVRLPSKSRDKYDVVLNMEVIEHLADNVVPHPDGSFYKTGVRNCLANCFQALKPDGYLFLTTPNSSSMECLSRWIGYSEVMNWGYHVREYGFNETVNLLKEAGFEIVRADTMDLYVHMKSSKMSLYLNWLKESIGTLGASRANRGETTFIIARKKE